MEFHLFKSKKNKHDQKQTDEIKEAANTSKPLFESNEQANPQNNNISNNNNFNNPFANQNPNLNNNNSEIQIQNPFEKSPSQILGESNPADNLRHNPFENDNSFPNQNLNNNNNNTSQTQSFQAQEPQSINSNQMNYNSIQENLSSSIESQTNNSVDYDKIQEMIDETVEKIIEEKWEKLLSSVDKVLKWKDKQENQMNLIKEDIVFLKDNVEKVEAKIINKISSYDKNILDVNSEIKALEKVFQKITPTLINNVNELSKIADEFRDSKPKNKANEDFSN